MTTSIDDLLTRLEHLTAEAVKATSPALDETPDTMAASELIAERGAVITQLNAALASATEPLSYIEFNRMVVIHVQGAKAEANLIQQRNDFANLLSTNTRDRALLDCITAVVEVPPVPVLNANA